MDLDLIVILYISEDPPSVDLSVFSKQNGFSLHHCTQPDRINQSVSSVRPDFIIFDGDWDALSRCVNRTGFNDSSITERPPYLFWATSAYPSFEQRQDAFQMGISDFLVFPFDDHEVKNRFRIYQQHDDLVQKRSCDRQCLA